MPFLNEQGKPRVAIRADITDRKRAEDALLDSNERFRQVAENINEVFWITDPSKNQMIYISPAYEKIEGRSCESLYQSPQDWLEAKPFTPFTLARKVRRGTGEAIAPVACSHFSSTRVAF